MDIGPACCARDPGSAPSRPGPASTTCRPARPLCPYHYEYAEEEWLLVLDGRPTLRDPDGTTVLEPWDLVFFPRGPEGAHGLRNETGVPARVMMWSTVITPAATVYPDSDKIGIWTGNKADDLIAPRSSKVDYYEGEVG